MHLRVDRPCSRQSRLLLRRQGDADLAHDVSRHFSLQGQHVTHVTLELCDQMISPLAPLISLTVICTMSVAPATEPSMMASTCSSRAMVGTGFRALRAHDGRARDHAESADHGEVSSEPLGHAVGEVFLVGVAGQFRAAAPRRIESGSQVASLTHPGTLP